MEVSGARRLVAHHAEKLGALAFELLERGARSCMVTTTDSTVPSSPCMGGRVDQRRDTASVGNGEHDLLRRAPSRHCPAPVQAGIGRARSRALVGEAAGEHLQQTARGGRPPGCAGPRQSAAPRGSTNSGGRSRHRTRRRRSGEVSTKASRLARARCSSRWVCARWRWRPPPARRTVRGPPRPRR